MAEDRKSCFFITPIGGEESEIRNRADQLLDHILVPVLTDQFGYEVLRADRDPNPGSITESMVGKIIGADLIVADLTDRNPNVFYELGIAHAYRIPVIHMIWRGQEMPFDVHDMRAIPYQTNDLAVAHQARLSLGAAVESVTSEGYAQVTPVAKARLISNAENTGGSEGQLLADIALGMAEVRVELKRVASTLVHQPTPQVWSYASVAPGDTLTVAPGALGPGQSLIVGDSSYAGGTFRVQPNGGLKLVSSFDTTPPVSTQPVDAREDSADD